MRKAHAVWKGGPRGADGFRLALFLRGGSIVNCAKSLFARWVSPLEGRMDGRDAVIGANHRFRILHLSGAAGVREIPLQLDLDALLRLSAVSGGRKPAHAVGGQRVSR